jgi:hypothetical protein
LSFVIGLFFLYKKAVAGIFQLSPYFFYQRDVAPPPPKFPCSDFCPTLVPIVFNFTKSQNGVVPLVAAEVFITAS